MSNCRPTRLHKTERHARILLILRGTPSLRVAELAAELNVTTETIRRDLDEMTAQGLLNRTYGGAIPAVGQEAALTERHRILTKEREAMASIVSSLIHAGETLALGSGATTQIVARRLSVDHKNLTVITHSFGVANVLAANSSLTILICPGYYREAEACTVGPQATEFIRSFTVDHAILGASGLTADGPNDVNAESAAVFQAMLERAANVIVVADHSKFNRPAFATYARWSRIDHLVTDEAPSGPLQGSLARARVEVLLPSTYRNS